MEAIQVPDMMCGACAQKIRDSLAGLAGIKQVEIELPTKTVKVEGDAARAKIVDAIRAAGYSPK